MTKQLPEYMQFNIYVKQSVRGLYVHFTDIDGSDLPPYRHKLTTDQWERAKKYVNRNLIDVARYVYVPKSSTTTGVYKIR